MNIRTHERIHPELCGTPVSVEDGRASVRLTLSANMAADPSGLCHGGFTFGLADYAAMLAVNQPTVVLGQAQVKFLRPTLVGDELLAEAVVERVDGKKRSVRASVKRAHEIVFEGEFLALVPDQHVLAKK